MISCVSRVRLCATPETAAHQAPPSLGFSRQEHWSGLPVPSPMHESEKWKWSHSVVLTFLDLVDCSPPGSSVHGIFQARVLEWGAIAFSKIISQWVLIVPTMHFNHPPDPNARKSQRYDQVTSLPFLLYRFLSMRTWSLSGMLKES